MTVADAPAASVPRAHGETEVLHGADAETNVRPVGVGSLSDTAEAFEGPLFVTLMVNVMFDPGVKVAGPVLVIERSAEGLAVEVAVALLLLGAGSPVAEEIDAVLLIVPLKLAGTA